MTPIKRRIAAATAPLLLALSLTACGGSDGADAPDGASKEDFCEAYNFEPEEPANIDTMTEDEQIEAVGDALQEGVDKVVEVGTPDDIPDDAREGFELYVDAAQDLSDDDIKAAITDEKDPFEETFSDDEQEKADAFEDWADEYCG